MTVDEDWLDREIRAQLRAWARDRIDHPPLDAETRRLDALIIQWMEAWSVHRTEH